MEDKLEMNLFSGEDSIDFTPNESENLEFLFAEESQEDGIEDTTEDDNAGNEDLDDNKGNDNITSEDDNSDPEGVVGDSNEDDVDGDDSNADNADDSSSNPNLFSSLAALLSEKGLISTTESEVTDEDTFIELFKSEIKKSEFADLTDIQKEYLENIRNGIPHEKVEKDISDISRLESITEDMIESDAELRQRIIYQDFVNRGFNDEKARQYLQRSIDLEQDLEDAKDAMNSIKEFTNERITKENQQLAEQRAELQKLEEKRLNSIKNKIKTTDEIIKGFTITDSVKEKIQKNMFEVVGTDPNSNQSENSLMKYRRENPEEFDHKLYYLFTITNGFQNFDSLVKNTKSKALKDLERAVQSNTKITDPGSPAYLQDPESYSIAIDGHDIVVD